MAGFGPDEEIELYEVSLIIEVQLFSIILTCLLYIVYCLVSPISLTILFNFQEIKFEPNIMCERIDKKTTFRASQVYGVDD
jgi:hypothetical protein